MRENDLQHVLQQVQGLASELGATEIKESRVHKLDAGFYQGNKVSFGVGAEKCTHQRV